MRFTQIFIEKALASNNIVSTLSAYTELKRSGGGRWVGLCPFPDHQEKTPSFSISEDKQFYYCFGCKRSGNLYHFLQEYQGLSFVEAVEYLAEKASLPLPLPPTQGAPNVYRRDTNQLKELWNLSSKIALFFHNQLMALPDNHSLWQYCRARGLSKKTIAEFQIGGTLDKWDGLCRHLPTVHNSQANSSLVLAEKLGLIRQKTKGQKGHYDLFRGRLIFPIVSHQSHVVGFGGRVLDDSLPKYINSPESAIFKKGQIFYGLHHSAKHIRIKDRVIVVEGYLDFLALYASGIQNVVATLGTALTEDHARLMKRYTQNVTLLYDGDSAGIKAANASLPILLKAGLFPLRVCLPDNQDPDDFIKASGKDELINTLNRAPELFELFLVSLFGDYSAQPYEKVAILDKVTPILLVMTDVRLRGLYIRELAGRLQESEAWIIQALKKALAGPAKKDGGVLPRNQAAPVREKPQNGAYGSVPRQSINSRDALFSHEHIAKEEQANLKGASRAEIMVMNLALFRESLLKSIESSQIASVVTNSGVRKILLKTISDYRQMPKDFDRLTASTMTIVSHPEELQAPNDEDWSSLSEAELDQMRSDASRRIQMDRLQIQAKNLQENLNKLPPIEQKTQLEQIMKLQKTIRDLQKGIAPPIEPTEP